MVNIKSITTADGAKALGGTHEDRNPQICMQTRFRLTSSVRALRSPTHPPFTAEITSLRQPGAASPTLSPHIVDYI